MEIIEIAAKLETPPARRLALADAAVAAAPGAGRLHVARAKVLLELGRGGEALVALERAIDLGGFADWAMLARCRRVLGDWRGVIAACDAGGGLAIERGRALQALGDAEGAATAFEAALAETGDIDALRGVLAPLAKLDDGQRLLDRIDALPPALQATAEARANRAIALSRLGREDEARALIDLDKCVVRMPIAVPEGYADLDAFNAALLAEAVRPESERATDISYFPETAQRPALTALFDVMKAALADYAARLGERGIESALPPPPARAALRTGITILRRDGHNGAHIHPIGYISSVYHAHVPPGLSGDRGALTLGGCGEYAGGYTGCWVVRNIPAVAGWLTLFPSHIFHDVIPTGVEGVRLSIVADLEPLIDGLEHPEIPA